MIQFLAAIVLALYLLSFLSKGDKPKKRKEEDPCALLNSIKNE